jgi:hypothetical protein
MESLVKVPFARGRERRKGWNFPFPPFLFPHFCKKSIGDLNLTFVIIREINPQLLLNYDSR